MAFNTVKPMILAGQSLSQAVNVSTGVVNHLFVPADWRSANLSFQVSPDNAIFFDVFDHDGREMLQAVRAGTAVPVDVTWTKGNWLKLRSGSCDAPVVQPVDCEFVIAIET